MILDNRPYYTRTYYACLALNHRRHGRQSDEER